MNSELIELANYVKKKLAEKKAQDTVITAVESSSNELKFVNNEIIKTSFNNGANIGIFTTFDKKIVLVPLKDLTKSGADKIVEKILKFVRHIEPKEDYFGIAEGPFKHKPIADTFDKKIENIDAKSQIDIVEAGINSALSQGATRASGISELSFAEFYKTTSNGVEASAKHTSAYFSIRALLDKEASGHATTSGCMLNKINVVGAGSFAGELARLSKNPVVGEAGKFDVLFAPLAIADFIERAGEALSIFDVETGMSFFEGLMNKDVASKNVNLFDDGRLPGGLGSAPFDAEGVPTQRTPLIKEGKLQTYLFNTSYARKYKTKTTANAGLISPGPHQLVLEPGKKDKDKIISQIDNGLYVTNLWYTRFQNYKLGDFSTIPRDGIFLIKNGKLSQPIKNVRISENMLHILKNVGEIANDVQQIASWEVGTPIFTPHVLVKGINITKPTA